MPYRSQYLDQGMGLHRWGEGVVTGAELIGAAVSQSLDLESTKQLRYILVDFTGVTGFDMASGVIHQLMEFNRREAEINPRICVAIVAPGQLAFGIARMWQSLAEDLKITGNAFHDRPTAIAWLRAKLGTEAAGPNSFPDLK